MSVQFTNVLALVYFKWLKREHRATRAKLLRQSPRVDIPAMSGSRLAGSKIKKVMASSVAESITDSLKRAAKVFAA